jgi:transcriptional regulator with XRE-family HTH domain
MAQEVPRQPREGSLIEEAAKATGLSVKKLSANAGISDTRWRHIVRGRQPAAGGGEVAVTAPAATLARMAHVVGVTAEQLVEAGRADAADLLQRIEAEPAGSPRLARAPLPADRGADEIDLIYASNMPARRKLELIRRVLQLRAEVELENTRERRSAPDSEESGALVDRG